MSKRLVSEPPRIVDKPLWGPKGDPEYGRAEQLKYEIQLFLESLADASNEAQLAIETLETASSTSSSSDLHPFLLMGA